MGKKKEENCNWTWYIIPVNQGYQEHCWGQSEVEACAEITETENQQ